MASADEELKRNFSRVPLSRMLRFRAETASAFRVANVANISMGGLYVQTDEPYEVGTKVYLQFMLENGDIVAEGWGRVTHTRETDEQERQYGPGMGLEFVSIDEKFIAFTQLVVSEELMQTRISGHR